MPARTKNNPATHLDALATAHVQRSAQQPGAELDARLVHTAGLIGASSAIPRGARVRDQHAVASVMPGRGDPLAPAMSRKAARAALDRASAIEPRIARADGYEADDVAAAPSATASDEDEVTAALDWNDAQREACKRRGEALVERSFDELISAYRARGARRA